MKKSIFTKLMGSFILFGILTVVTFVLCLFFQAALLSGGNMNTITPQGVIDDNGNVTELDSAEKIGGWVEEIDKELNIIDVYGNKKNTQKSYSNSDILELTSPYGNTEYIGFYITPKNTDRAFLVIYDRDVMQVDTSLIVNKAPGFESVNVMWLFFPLLALEIVLLSLYLRRKIKRPLDKINEGMEHLKSDSSARITPCAEAEFKKIVDTFNSMAEELEKEKKEKESLVAKKNQFLLELSHDIKTPVATIKSYANALEAGLVPEEKKESYYRTIDAKADRVHTLSDDMFMMLKMDNPDYVIKSESVDLCEYLRQLCAEYYGEITRADLVFEIDIPEEKIEVSIDKSLFARVIGNLLTNARKYNKLGNLILLACYMNGDTVTIKVCDNGEKIPDELTKQMFNAFVRGDKTRRSDGGTGLGLTISKIIVEKHGGRIRYQRENDMNVFIVEI